MSRTVLRALAVNWWINPAYWTVVELSIVVLIGMPIRKRRALSKWNNPGGSSRVSNTRNWDGVVPSTLTTIIPITPLWLWILFSDSSTSDCQEEKKIVIRHDHKESKHEKVNCNSHHFHFLLHPTCFSAKFQLRCHGTEPLCMVGDFFWVPLIKDSCFSKCHMRIGQQVLTRGTGHKSRRYFRLICVFPVLFITKTFWRFFIILRNFNGATIMLPLLPGWRRISRVIWRNGQITAVSYS